MTLSSSPRSSHTPRHWEKSTTPSRDEIEKLDVAHGHFMTSDPIGWPQVRRGQGVGSRLLLRWSRRCSSCAVLRTPSCRRSVASMIDAPSPTTRWRRPPVRMSCQRATTKCMPPVCSARDARLVVTVDGVRRWQLHRRQGYRAARLPARRGRHRGRGRRAAGCAAMWTLRAASPGWSTSPTDSASATGRCRYTRRVARRRSWWSGDLHDAAGTVRLVIAALCDPGIRWCGWRDPWRGDSRHYAGLPRGAGYPCARGPA